MSHPKLVWHLARLCVFISLTSVFFALTASSQACHVDLHHSVGRKPNIYVWTCDDQRGAGINPNNEENVIARIAETAPPTDQTSTARVSRTVSCFEAAIAKDRRLSNCCDHPRRWEHLGLRAMRECISSTARPGEKPTPVKYSRKECTAVFAGLFSEETAAVWLCLCSQPKLVSRLRFDIVPGRAQYTIKKSPTSPAGEVSFIQRCSRSSFQQLRRVCRETPGNFDTLSLQLMQTCCKRARTIFKDDKLECAAIIP